MSIEIVNKFQLKIYNILASNPEIKDIIENNCYLSIIENSTQPCLLIDILHIKNLSLITQTIYDIQFEVSAFSREKNQKILFKLATIIEKLLKIDNFWLENFLVSSIKYSDISFHKGSDMLSNKLSMQYFALIKNRS
ncbi:hypothetical protein [Rickettsia endosymbiont of Cardiosporidium cionae]|uniref:hypothetical protein n=1 Tax=Rickettsia endosymbiont of Cardiosporidium cionae TaxID=2777155 RepID=UPI0018955871|nr:hypothetical protein [Rickettsia endosymbiont of Cardiosporidium cionae]KAF8818803.1 hypothetical protein IHI24_000037 [Rickettsia endosymbiont of Cardiosporidium cionae]